MILPNRMPSNITQAILPKQYYPSNIMYLYRGHSASMSIGKGEKVDEESNNEIERRASSQKSDAPHTNSFMYFFL